MISMSMPTLIGRQLSFRTKNFAPSQLLGKIRTEFVPTLFSFYSITSIFSPTLSCLTPKFSRHTDFFYQVTPLHFHLLNVYFPPFFPTSSFIGTLLPFQSSPLLDIVAAITDLFATAWHQIGQSPRWLRLQLLSSASMVSRRIR